MDDDMRGRENLSIQDLCREQGDSKESAASQRGCYAHSDVRNREDTSSFASGTQDARSLTPSQSIGHPYFVQQVLECVSKATCAMRLYLCEGLRKVKMFGIVQRQPQSLSGDHIP